MTSQVIFNLDSKIKAKAMKRAKAEGVPFSSFLKMAAEMYAKGEWEIALVPNAKTARELKQASKDYREGKNISPAFASDDEAEKYLRSL